MPLPLPPRAMLAVPISLVLLACGDRAGPPQPAEVQDTGGGGQIGPVMSLLPEPIVATVLDAAGAPLPGVSVSWSAEGDGRVVPLSTVTDQQGRVQARWVLGGTVGPSHATAAVGELEPATFTAIAESPDQLPFGEVHLLDIPTYEGSGQVVHPDYARVPTDAFANAHHLAITPYPYGDASHENPSHFAGAKLDAYRLEPGAPNPVVRPREGHLSDPDLLYVPEHGELWLYYRQVTSENTVLLTRSADGIRWSPPVEVVRAPNHRVVSPTVVRRGPGDWWMYAVNAGALGCSGPYTTVDVRRSMDGIAWSAPERVALEQQALFAWHIEVQWVPSRSEFWALYNVKRNGDCATPAIFLATSPDGYAWTVLERPVLARGGIPELGDIVYRSSFLYDPVSDGVTFWYSGARHNGEKYVWSAAVQRRRREEVFAPSVMLEAVAERWGDPPEPLLDGP